MRVDIRQLALYLILVVLGGGLQVGGRAVGDLTSDTHSKVVAENLDLRERLLKAEIAAGNAVQDAALLNTNIQMRDAIINLTKVCDELRDNGRRLEDLINNQNRRISTLETAILGHKADGG